MSFNADFGEKHSHFQFRFATNTLPSKEQKEIAERQNDTDIMLKLSGIPADVAMSTGWRVQPLRMPPLVNKQCNVIINIHMIFKILMIFFIYFIYRSTEKMLMIIVNQ